MCLQWCHVHKWIIDNDVRCSGCERAEPNDRPEDQACDTCKHRRFSTTFTAYGASIDDAKQWEWRYVDGSMTERTPVVTMLPSDHGVAFVVRWPLNLSDVLIECRGTDTASMEWEPIPSDTSADGIARWKPNCVDEQCALTGMAVPSYRWCCHWNCDPDRGTVTVRLAPWLDPRDHRLPDVVDSNGTSVSIDQLARPLVYGIPQVTADAALPAAHCPSEIDVLYDCMLDVWCGRIPAGVLRSINPDTIPDYFRQQWNRILGHN